MVQYHASLFDIRGDDVASKRYYRGVTDNIIEENGNVGSAAPYIHQTNACFFFLFAQHREAGTQRLQDQVLDLQFGPSHTFVNVVDGIRLRRDHMKVRFQFYPRHAYRITDILLVIHDIILRHHMYDFASGRNHNPVHVVGQLIHVFNGDLIVR